MSGKAMLEEVWGILLVVGFDFVFFRMALPGLSVTVTGKQHAGVCVAWLKIVGRKMQGISSLFFCFFLGGCRRVLLPSVSARWCCPWGSVERQRLLGTGD